MECHLFCFACAFMSRPVQPSVHAIPKELFRYEETTIATRPETLERGFREKKCQSENIECFEMIEADRDMNQKQDRTLRPEKPLFPNTIQYKINSS